MTGRHEAVEDAVARGIDREAAEAAFAEREEQGLPLLVEDPLAYRDLATLMREPTRPGAEVA